MREYGAQIGVEPHSESPHLCERIPPAFSEDVMRPHYTGGSITRRTHASLHPRCRRGTPPLETALASGWGDSSGASIRATQNITSPSFVIPLGDTVARPVKSLIKQAYGTTAPWRFTLRLRAEEIQREPKQLCPTDVSNVSLSL